MKNYVYVTLYTNYVYTNYSAFMCTLLLVVYIPDNVKF